MPYNVDRLNTLNLGEQGENLAQTIEIDVSSMLAQWPQAVFSILVKRPGDTEPYVSACSLSGSIVQWPITAAETAKAGEGQMELQCISGSVLAKSKVVTITVAECIQGDPSEDPPEPSQGWVDEVLQAASDVEALRSELVLARDAANTAAASANLAAGQVNDAVADMENETTNAILDMQQSTTDAVDEMNAAFAALGLAVQNGLLCANYVET